MLVPPMRGIPVMHQPRRKRPFLPHENRVVLLVNTARKGAAAHEHLEADGPGGCVAIADEARPGAR
jgi:hypothetical protein